MTVAEVRMWGRTIGAVSWDPDQELAFFEYDGAFRRSGVQVAPLTMPLGVPIYSFAALRGDSFHGLPGLLADSLPDRFGNALIDAWLARQGRAANDFDPVERLCYVGRRGMGALEFEPATGPDAGSSELLEVEHLVELASAILSERGELQPALDGAGLAQILRVGTSAGGARAKAVIAWNPATNEVRSGQVDVEAGFSHWILKFDGVSGNRDKELEDPAGYGLVEYAYHLMAVDAGIEMTECRLFAEGPRHHFMTRRFDRADDGGRIHMQSLGALAHLDFNRAGAHSYEQAFGVLQQIGCPASNREQMFRRMVFNVVARNQDDHVKNIAFLMDRGGNWELAPAFDVTYSHNPDGAWTASHQMSVNGKRERFVAEDFRAVGDIALLERGRWRAVLDAVTAAVKRWPEYASRAGVDDERAAAIAAAHRLDLGAQA